MSLRDHTLHLTILFIIILNIFSVNVSLTLTEKIVNDDWKAIIDIDDPKVTKAAEFAVEEHNRQENTSISFVYVSLGKTKTDDKGTHYRMTINAFDAHIGDYCVYVIDKGNQKDYELVSFTGPLSKI
ncbi:cysteine proteinase inhibitor 1-like [Rutidosis leptorrhynchoides]|uniref:cysteine proteinase inhibitor 1-like n=1 Tax=Rutidosis leptorrhynchoides TaxID=125765 RepID=UPI003A9964C5